MFTDEYTASLIPAIPDSLMLALDKARRLNLRILVNFTGHSSHMRDPDGFSMVKWKARVDRFRGLDLSSYIDDGTIVGHFLLDEATDPSNWNGDQVTPSEIEELAKYSKEIWPSMATIIRTYPVYLLGREYKYLDAVRVHYVERLGPIQAYNDTHVRDAKALGLALINGLNVLNGSKSSGIPGRHQGRFAMSASEIRSWGGLLLSDPYICAFFVWEWDPYLSRPEIKEALHELQKKAESYPKKTCKTK